MENIIKRAEILGQMKALNVAFNDAIISENKYLAYRYKKMLSDLEKEYTLLEETKNLDVVEHS